MSKTPKVIKNKIAIIGVGAIGSVITNALRSNPKNQLSFYTRSPKSEIKIEFEGKKITIPIECKSELGQDENLDWLIICLKAHQFKDAHHLFKALISKNTKVAIIRNGINLSKDIEPYTFTKNILPCMVDCPVQPMDNGFYKQFRSSIITTKTSALAKEFEQLFVPHDITVNQVDDFKTANWIKLIESAALGSILCLTGQTCHIFRDPKILNLCQQLIKEGIQVAIADGANIDQNLEYTLIQKIANYPDDKGSSMLTDRLLGNKIELEAKNGAIVNVASTRGIPAPLNTLFCTLIEKINSKSAFTQAIPFGN